MNIINIILTSQTRHWQYISIVYTINIVKKHKSFKSLKYWKEKALSSSERSLLSPCSFSLKNPKGFITYKLNVTFPVDEGPSESSSLGANDPDIVPEASNLWLLWARPKFGVVLAVDKLFAIGEEKKRNCFFLWYWKH